MADNLTFGTTLATVPSGTVISTDDIGSSVQVQNVKLMDGTSGSSQVIAGDTQGLYVVTHRDLQAIVVASGGLTTASTSYSAGDQVGTQFTMAGAARSSGGTGTIVGCTLISAADITGPYDVVVAKESISLASDNAAYAISDADANKLVGIIQLVGGFDIGNNRLAQAWNLSIPYLCTGGTSLYCGLITRAAHTFFGAVTDLQLTLWVERN